MHGVLQNLVSGIALGSLYALFGLGIALIFGVMRLINLAQGELIMAGAYAVTVLHFLPWPLVVISSVLVAVILSLVMNRVAFRPLREADATTMLVASFAVSFFLQNLALTIFGGVPQSTDLAESITKPVTIFGLEVSKLDLLTMGVTISLVTLLGLLLQRTRVGLEMRAAAEDFRMARVLGVSANRVIATAFALSGLLAGVAAVLIVIKAGTVTTTIGVSPVLIAFVVTIVGGLGSLRGAVLGGLLLGCIVVFLQFYLPADLRVYREAFVYAAVLAILVLRPGGLITVSSRVTRV